MATYKINAEPGSYVQGYGFFYAGQQVILPDDIPPSRTWTALDAAAVAALAKIGVKAELNIDPVVKLVEPKDDITPVTMDQQALSRLLEMSKDRPPPTQPAVGENPGPQKPIDATKGTPPGVVKRASDKVV